jgi:hypothetical protein
VVVMMVVMMVVVPLAKRGWSRNHREKQYNRKNLLHRSHPITA